MKILMYSPAFYPSLGGLEMVVFILSHQFVEEGHEVIVVCTTPDPEDKVFPFKVIRYPNPQQLFKLVKWCDIYFSANVSLKGIYPLLRYHKPCVVCHQGWYTRTNGDKAWQDYLKHFVTRFVHNISASQSVANHLSVPSTVIPNPYREEIFYEMPEISRTKDLVFLGRFVSDKGADLLIRSLANLKQQKMKPNLTMIGKGPEEDNLRQLVKDLDLTEQVSFIGAKFEHELATILNQHKIMVVPSLWDEPFGIVALEGIACGCVVVGSEGGGLKDAIGCCGVTFPNGNIEKLTDALFDLLTYPEQYMSYQRNVKSHLNCHTGKAVAKAYLEVIETLVT